MIYSNGRSESAQTYPESNMVTLPIHVGKTLAIKNHTTPNIQRHCRFWEKKSTRETPEFPPLPESKNVGTRSNDSASLTQELYIHGSDKSETIIELLLFNLKFYITKVHYLRLSVALQFLTNFAHLATRSRNAQKGLFSSDVRHPFDVENMQAA